MTPSRRGFLRTTGGLVLGGVLAGCNDDADAGTPSASPTASRSPTSTSPPTAAATATPTPSPTDTAAPTPSTAADARSFVADLHAGEFEAALEDATDEFATQLPASTLERYWLGLTAQHGAVEEIVAAEPGTRNGSAVQVVPVTCTEATQDVQVAFDDAGLISGLWFPGEYASPDYVDESAFTERTLALEPEGCSLPATLTVPEGDGPFPGVALVHGSGAHDRDETIGPNKPFRDLAEGLASRGVAVLRYEKRTAACDVPRAEWSIDRIIVDDAVHALGVLREQSEVDPAVTAAAGHSVGATCVPRIAERDGDVAGGILLAGNARPFTEVYPEQVENVFSVQGGLSAREERQLDAVRGLMDAVERGEVADDREIGPLPGIWWKTLAEYDQVATARELDVPLFAVQPGRDFQIPPEPAIEGWRDALPDGDGHQVASYDDLSHLLQSGAEPSLSTEYQFADNVAESVVVDLADWVAETVA